MTPERKFRKVFSRRRLEDERLEELLDIAAEVFLAEGFNGASTNVIARRAKASKATFYSRFPTKEDLFLAVLERRSNRIAKVVTPLLDTDAPPDVALRDFGRKLVHGVLTGEQVAFVRMIGMEAERFPKLAQHFYELGPRRALEMLTAYLRQSVERGHLRGENPERMAEHFISLVTGGDIRWFILGLRPKPGPKLLDDHLRAALEAFLLAYGSEKKRAKI